MSHDESSSTRQSDDRPYEPSVEPRSLPHDSRRREEDEPPVSLSWSAVAVPWGTPGNHLTGPIPRIRRAPDGSLTHDEGSV